MIEATEHRFHQLLYASAGNEDHHTGVPCHLWPLLYIVRKTPGAVFAMPAGHAPAPVVEARINHGVWQGRCPFCPSAQHVTPNDPLFFCGDCRNLGVGMRTVTVVFPPNRPELEAALAARPAPRYRNWEPGETVADLRRQDAEAVAGRGV